MSSCHAIKVLRFVLLVGVMCLFADGTYEASRGMVDSYSSSLQIRAIICSSTGVRAGPLVERLFLVNDRFGPLLDMQRGVNPASGL